MKLKRHRWVATHETDDMVPRVCECRAMPRWALKVGMEISKLYDCAGCGAVTDYIPHTNMTSRMLDEAWANGIGPFVDMVNEAKEA